MAHMTVLPTGEIINKPSLCVESECALHKIGSGFTEVEVGPRYAQTKLLLLGEASGESEAREGLPFRPYAQSGSLLADAMRECNISRADVAISNIVRCRPPKDWLEGAPWQYSALSNCIKNYLYDVIKSLRPRAILALGGTAFRALTVVPKGKYGTLDYARGYVQRGEGPAAGIPVIATYHPAYLRRGAAHLTPPLQRDLRRAFLLAVGKLREGEHYALDIANLGLKYQTSPTIEEAWEWANSIDPALPLSLDLETPRSTREDEDERVSSFTDRDIVLFQATQRRGEGIAIPYRDEYIEVIRAIMRAKSGPRLGHNWWSFDAEVMRANGFDNPDGFDDTMIMYGFYWSDLPRNLQAAAQQAGFSFPWKHLNEVDQAFYGCADVDGALAVYQYMRRLLESEGMWESYRTYFARVWPILRDMSRRGIPIDSAARGELKSLIDREDQRVTAAIQEIVPAEILSTKQANGYKNPPILTCEECGWKGRTDHLCTPIQEESQEELSESEPPDSSASSEPPSPKLIPYRDLAESHGLVLREVTLKEEEKCRCKKKERESGSCAVCAGSGIIPAGTVEMRWATPTAFNPNSSLQVKRFMKFMRHPVPKHQKRVDAQGEASDTTEVKELERLFAKTKHPIYPLLIQKRQLTKVEGTYHDGWAPWADGCVHPTFTFQTAIWQLSARQPNCQNGIKHADPEKQPLKYGLAKAFNGMQKAQEGRVLINFDFKSFFPITMSHDFNMPRYCRLARLDIHSFVTCYFLKLPERVGLWERSDEDMLALFKQLKKDTKFKFTRDYKSKRVILGMGNGLFYRKMYQVHREDFENENEAKNLYETVSALFPELKRGQEAVKKKAAEEKRLVNKFGAIRHFFDVQHWDRKQQKMVGGDQAEAAIAFLPSSHAFGHARDVMLRLREKGWDERYGLINTIHDSLIFHCSKELAEECVVNVKAEMERKSTVLIYPGMAPDGVWVGVETAVGDSLAGMKEVK